MKTTTGKQICMVFTGEGTYEWALKKSSVFTSTAYTETLANGRAIGLDGEGAVIDCNSIVQDYVPAMMLPDVLNIYSILSNGTVYQGQSTNYNSGVESFGLYIDGVLSSEWTVLSDYSGENWDGNDKTLSCPINGHIDARQIITTSFFSNASRNITVERV